MLAGAEAARTVESANVMHSLVLHSGRQGSQSFKGRMAEGLEAAGSEMIPSTDSLMSHLTALNTSAQDVLDGRGFWRVKYCMMTCPLIWTKIIYHSWLARSDAKTIVAESFAAQDDVAMLPTVSRPLGDSFRGTMRKTVWTFLKVIDESIVQRILLALFFAPLGLFRVLTKMSPLGLCFLKQAWKDLEATEGYEQKHTTWWRFFLAGCPDQPPATAAFEDEASTSDLMGSMVYALAKPDGLEMEDQAVKWGNASTHVQCVNKMSRKGEWSKRRIMIEKGTITWTADSICKDVGVIDQVREFFGHEKVFSLEFLTKPPEGDTVELFNGTDCINFQNPYRQFTFCAEPGYTMQKAKSVMDEHLGILGGEHQLLQMTAKVERLIVASGVAKGDERAEEELKELAEGMDDSGDTSVEGLALQIGNISDSEAPEVQKAKQILEQVQKGSSLLALGDVHGGTALLQEAYAAAHRHEKLSDIMHGKAKKLDASGAVEEPGAASAGAAGGISTTELIIILAICGFGVLCVGIGLAIAANNFLEVDELESKVQVLSNVTRALPLPHVA